MRLFPLLVAAPAALAAQQPDTAARPLPPVEVIGSVLPVAAPGVASNVPARVGVLEAKQLRAWQPRMLTDALATLAGASLHDDLGSPYKRTLVTRGFSSSPVVGLPQGVSVFVDGVPVNDPDAGQVNFDLLPLAHVERVEVLSGTASLLGPNSLGGAVNLVTRDGAAHDGNAELTLGSRAERGFTLAQGARRGAWTFYAGGDHEQEGGWRQLTGARRTLAFAKAGRGTAARSVTLTAFLAQSRAETAGSLPASVYATRPDSNLSSGDFEDLRQLHVALSGHAALGRGVGVFSLYARANDAERFNVNQEDDPDVRNFSENASVGATMDWRTGFALGRGTGGFRVGGGGQASRTRVRLFAERIDPGLTTDVESPIAKLDAFALADYQVGRLAISGGARWDLVRVPYRNNLDRAKDTTSTYVRLSPRAGARLALGGGASVYASAGQSFRAPAVIELACADPEEPCPLPFALGDDPPLDPVIATTYEVGMQWIRGPFVLDAAAFTTAVRDDIFLLPYEEEGEPEGSTIDGYFANIPRTRRAGVEASALVQLGAGHTIRATYGATRATFESAAEIFSPREHADEENAVEPGDELPLVPRRTAAIDATVALGRGVTAGALVRHVGERWLRGDEANETEPLPAAWETSLRAGYEGRRGGVQVVVDNVLGTRYSTFGTFNVNQGGGGVLERFLTPSEPRRVRVVVGVRW